jgi:hypothetical protein
VLSTKRFDKIPGLATRENGSSALAGRISRNTIFPVFTNKATTGNKCMSSYLINNGPQDSGFLRYYIHSVAQLTDPNTSQEYNAFILKDSEVPE